MSARLEVLVLEDSENDAKLVERALRTGDVDCQLWRVDTRDGFVRALQERAPDLILADYAVPGFDGRAALKLARTMAPGIPLIIVTGAIVDEMAAELLREGAADYILKDRLSRLPSAVCQALAHARQARAELDAQRGLRVSEERFRRLFEEAKVGIAVLDGATCTIVDVNPFLSELSGFLREELVGKGLDVLLGAPAGNGGLPPVDSLSSGPRPLRKRSGAVAEVEVVSTAYQVDGARFTQCLIRDVTARRASEHKLRLFRELLDRSVDSVFIVDAATGQLLDFSASSCPALGYSSAELLAATIFDLAPGVDKPQFQRLAEQSRKEGFVLFEVILRRRDGSTFPAEVTVSLAVLDREYALAFVRDTTQRKQTEEALSQANRALLALSQCGNALIVARDQEWLLGEVCRILIETGNYHFAWVGFAQPHDTEGLRAVAHAGRDERYLEGISLTWHNTSPGHGPAGMAVRTQKSQMVEVPAAAMSPLAPGRAADRGCRAILAVPLSCADTAMGVLCIETARVEGFNPKEQEMLNELADDLAFGIATLRARAEHERTAERLRRSMESTIEALAGMLEMRDAYTAGHQRRVAQLAGAIARELDYPEEEVQGIQLAALVHDLGKIQVPADILTKPAKLSPLEFELVKIHAQTGYELLKEIDFPWPIADLVRQHHERLDGSGYPQGLRGEQILPGARILGVCDTVEAMASARPYRAAIGLEPALDQIRQNRGILYDAGVVDACVRLFREKRFAFSL